MKKNRKIKILITGGAGFIGYHLAKNLSKECTVDLIDNLSRGKADRDFKRLIKERAKRKPIAYILNKKFFWDSEFYVDENTLIPRPDTEVIIEEILRLTKYKNKLNILDIGVGSGCILLTILKERK